MSIYILAAKSLAHNPCYLQIVSCNAYIATLNIYEYIIYINSYNGQGAMLNFKDYNIL